MRDKQNQNKIFIAGFFLILAVIVWALARPAILKLTARDGNSEEMINAEILKAPVISAKNLLEEMKNEKKFLIFDLRGRDEFEKNHLAGSLNVASGELDAEKLKSLGAEKTSPIVILNQGDDAFEMAGKINELVSAGYANAKYLQGGISDWQAEAYPVVSGGKSPLDDKKIKKIGMDELSEVLSGGPDVVQFVDLRSAEKFKAGHVPGALNLPFSELEKNRNSISAARKVVVYSENEDESFAAAAALFDLNFFNIFVLSGGLEVWTAGGGKIE